MGNTIKHFKPDFFIPGFAKSGTSSLHDLLNSHPDISMSKLKEPVYWNNKSFDKFDDFEIVRYSDLFEKDTKIKGESTTSYMFYDSFIKNINKYYKEPPKFIIILRNPVDRFISHVNWLKGLGLEKKDINEVLMDEKWSNFNEYDDYPRHYYQFGLYHKWISRFIDNFGKQNIKIITFEQLISDRLNTINDCYEFLGVEKLGKINFIRSNKSKKIVFPYFYHFLRKSSTGKMKYTKIVKYLLPIKIREKIKSLMKCTLQNWISVKSKNEKITTENRNKLRKIYLEDVESLKKRLVYDFSEWEDFKL